MMLTLPESYFVYLEQTLKLDLQTQPFGRLKPFLPHIKNISEHLSKNTLRSAFTEKPYLNEREYRRAYQLYYTTANLLKIYIPLNDIAHSGFFQNKKQIRVLDIGSGTGTMILGLLAWLEAHHESAIQELQITAIDHSGAALKELQTNVQQNRNLKINTIVHDFRSPIEPGEAYDLVIAGNVLNELAEDSRKHLLKSLTHLAEHGGFIVCIEPALKNTSRVLLEFRNAWIENGGFVYSPCCTRQPCPALDHPDDWCHHDVPWNRPPFIEYIDESVGLIKKSLKFTYMVLTRADTHVLDYSGNQRNLDNSFRVVSELFSEKGRYRAFLCNDHGRLMFEKNKRDDSAINQYFNHLNRYDLIRVINRIQKKDLVKVLPETEIHLLSGDEPELLKIS